MNKKELTPTQIKELHNLVQRNAIQYYDVEVEIVDHYASAIEAIWEKEPEISFYQAQMRVYKEFWDFQKLQRDKEQQLSVQANHMAWNIIKEMFGWPKVLELLLFFTFIWVGFSSLNLSSDWVSLFIYGCMCAPALYSAFLVSRFEKKIKNRFIGLYAITTTYSLFPTIIPTFSYFLFDLNSAWIVILVSFLLAIHIVLVKDIYVILRRGMNKLEKQFA